MYESKNSFYLLQLQFLLHVIKVHKTNNEQVKNEITQTLTLNFKFIIFMQHTVAQLVIALKLISNKFWRVILKTKLNKVL